MIREESAEARENDALPNSAMNPPALSSVGLLLPGAVARRTRFDYTAPGCLAI